MAEIPIELNDDIFEKYAFSSVKTINGAMVQVKDWEIRLEQQIKTHLKFTIKSMEVLSIDKIDFRQNNMNTELEVEKDPDVDKWLKFYAHYLSKVRFASLNYFIEKSI